MPSVSGERRHKERRRCELRPRPARGGGAAEETGRGAGSAGAGPGRGAAPGGGPAQSLPPAAPAAPPGPRRRPVPGAAPGRNRGVCGGEGSGRAPLGSEATPGGRARAARPRPSAPRLRAAGQALSHGGSGPGHSGFRAPPGISSAPGEEMVLNPRHFSTKMSVSKADRRQRFGEPSEFPSEHQVLVFLPFLLKNCSKDVVKILLLCSVSVMKKK